MHDRTQELRTQIAEVAATIQELERRQLAGTVSELLQAERTLTDNRALFVRLQDALSSSESAQEATEREQSRQADLAELADLEAQHSASMALAAHAANVVAGALENALETVEVERLKVLETAGKHRYLYHRIHGVWPAGSEALNGRSAEMPGKHNLQGENPSELFGVAALAVMIALHTKAGGPLSLQMVNAYLGAATAR